MDGRKVMGVENLYGGGPEMVAFVFFGIEQLLKHFI